MNRFHDVVGAPVARIRAVARNLDAAVVSPGPATVLIRLQIFLTCVIGLRLATRDWTLISERPAELTYKLWLLGWLPAPFPPGLVDAIQVAGLAGVALVLTRTRPRLGYALAWSAYFLLAGLWGASGKFMHNDILTITVGVVLLFAHVPAAVGTDSGKRRIAWGWPPRAALAVLGTVYFLTGVQKLRHSGLAWVFSDNMAWVLRQRPSQFGDDLTRFTADTPFLPQLLAGGALLLELGAPILLYFAATRLWFAVGVTAMHTSIWVYLGLDYSAWVLTAWAVVLATILPRAGETHQTELFFSWPRGWLTRRNRYRV